MRLTTRGRPLNIERTIVGRIAVQDLTDPAEAVLLTDGRSIDKFPGYRAVLTADTLRVAPSQPTVHSLRETDHLRDGDIVAISPKGEVRTLFRPDSDDNTLFVTERCNSNCLMCSQPPKDRDDRAALMAINTELIRLMPSDVPVLGITGGEPTLLREDLFSLLRQLKDSLPRTHIHMLTNGRMFAWPEFTRAFASVRHPDLVLGIPLYSDSAIDHDYIVQAKGAFDQTILGLHSLARWSQSIELRVVLHKLTIPRLQRLAEYVYRDFPFVGHVALMGLEPTGYTPYNRERLWIDPDEYQSTLAETVEYLSIRGMNVSIYNLQRCVLPEVLWPFARRSISDWKNIYLPECEGCSQMSACAGFFQSAERFHGEHIRPV